MKGLKTNEYQKNGRVVSVFAVSGTSAELSAYEAHQGENFRKDDASGKPLFYATAQADGIFEGQSVDIIFAEGEINDYIIDKTVDKRKNALLAKHAGTPMGDILADKMAQELLDACSTSAPASAPAPVVDSSDEEENSEE